MITQSGNELAWPNTTKLIVDKMDSYMSLANEFSVSVYADHFAICQFDDGDDTCFMYVVTTIRDVLQGRLGKAPPPASRDA